MVIDRYINKEDLKGQYVAYNGNPLQGTHLYIPLDL